MISEQEVLLQKLRNNDRSAYIQVYNNCYPDLARYILRNQGNREDSEDLFQECMVILLLRLRTDNFELKSALKTYLYAVNKNLWLKKLRERKLSVSEALNEDEHVVQEEDFLSLQEQQAEKNSGGLLSRLFENITSHCVILITRIFLKQEQSEQLIQELGYKNSHTFQNQKYKCINQLRKAGKKISVHG